MNKKHTQKTKDTTIKDKYWREILSEQCKRVGVKYEDVIFSDSNWYLEHTWTEKEQESFRDWIVEYLDKNKEARQSVLSTPNLASRERLVQAADDWIMNYGWKQK